MDRIKEINYLREDPTGSFPLVETVSPEELQRLQDRIRTLVGAEGSPSGVELIGAIRANSVPLVEYDAGGGEFSIQAALTEHGVKPLTMVYVNWGRLDGLDRMRVDDLDRFFTHIWYPSSDDIEIFDADVMWVLSVAHDGTVLILHPPKGSRDAIGN